MVTGPLVSAWRAERRRAERRRRSLAFLSAVWAFGGALPWGLEYLYGAHALDALTSAWMMARLGPGAEANATWAAFAVAPSWATLGPLLAQQAGFAAVGLLSLAAWLARREWGDPKSRLWPVAAAASASLAGYSFLLGFAVAGGGVAGNLAAGLAFAGARPDWLLAWSVEGTVAGAGALAGFEMARRASRR